jgi:DNA-binding CsgD family transcriptional regulator
MSEDAERAARTEADVALAELRLAQGRLEEAERLVDGIGPPASTTHVLAAIRLARDEPRSAASMLRREIRPDGAAAERAGLVELLVEAEVSAGDTEAAVAEARRLLGSSAAPDGELVAARGRRTMGRALLGVGDAEGSRAHLQPALETFGRLELPLEVGRTRLLLAAALAEADRDAAIAEARAALECFETLGAGRDADQAAAFLRLLGVRAARSAVRGLATLTKREREVLALLREGLSNPQIAARLYLARKTVEKHVANVLAKLGLSGRAEAAAFAVRHDVRAAVVDKEIALRIG